MRKLLGLLAIVAAFAVSPLSAQFGPHATAYKTLGAVNDTVVIQLDGQPFVGVSVFNAGIPSTPGVANMCLITEFSNDGGVTWDERLMGNGDEAVIVDCLPHFAEVTRTYTVYVNPADTHVRIRVFSYVSGTARVRLAATTVSDPASQIFTRLVSSLTTTLAGAGQTVEVPTWGLRGAGFVFNTTNFIGTLVVEASALSHDTTGVGTWANKIVIGGAGACWSATGIPLTGTSVTQSIGVPLGATDYRLRVRVLSYTSGSLTIRGRATGQDDWSKYLLNMSIGVACPSLFTSWVRETQSTKINARDLTSTKVAVKASAGTLRGVTIVNNQAAVTFIQLYDVASAGVTVGTTLPDFEFQCAANATCPATIPAGGKAFAVAITAVATTTEKGASGSAAGVQAFFDIQ